MSVRPTGLAAAAIGALLVACQAGAPGAASPTVPAADPARSATPAPSASMPPRMPSASPTEATTVASAAPRARGAPVDPRADGLDVTFGEFAITLEAGVVRPGAVTLIVHNAGRLTHGFEMKLHGSGSGGDRWKIETRTFRAGETLRVEADLPPGTYEIECFVADHDSKGMRASLEVRPDAPLVAPVPGAVAPDTVRIVQFAFVAAELEVPAGSRLTFTNDDPAPHTITADGGAFDSRQLDPGASFIVKLDAAGTFRYHCEIHPTMVGAVLVL